MGKWQQILDEQDMALAPSYLPMMDVVPDHYSDIIKQGIVRGAEGIERERYDQENAERLRFIQQEQGQGRQTQAIGGSVQEPVTSREAGETGQLLQESGLEGSFLSREQAQRVGLESRLQKASEQIQAEQETGRLESVPFHESHPAINMANRLIAETNASVIVTGGISRLEHLRRINELGADGAIIGKALYTGDINLREAIVEFGG